MSAVAMVAPGAARPGVVSAAWDLLAARDEVASAGEQFDGLTRNRQERLPWEGFTAWRDGLYVPAQAALASAVVTFTVLVDWATGDPALVAERIVASDIDAAVPQTASVQTVGVA